MRRRRTGRTRVGGALRIAAALAVSIGTGGLWIVAPVVAEETGRSSAPSGTPQEQAARSALNTGSLSLKSGDFDMAIKYFTEAIDLGGLSAEGIALAYHHRGIAYQKKGKPGVAIADYTKAIWQEALPRSVAARSHYNRGIAYAATQAYEKAEQDYTAAIVLNPAYASAYHNRANLRRSRGDVAGAIADYNAALSHLDDGGAHLPLFGRGLAKEELGDRDGALADVAEAVRRQPDYELAVAKLTEMSGEPVRVANNLPREIPAREVLSDHPKKIVTAAYVPPPQTVRDAPPPQVLGDETGTPSPWQTTVTRFAPGSEAPVSAVGELALRPSDTQDDAGTTGSIKPLNTQVLSPIGPIAASEKPDEKPGAAGTPGGAAPAEKAPRPYRIQIGSYRSVAEAEKSWTNVGSAHSALFTGLQPYIAEADLGDKGIYYRLQLGPLGTRKDAGALCAALKAKKVDCIVTRP